jgi:hypothetical protein
MQRKIIILLAALVVAFMFVGAASAATPVASKATVSATVPTGTQDNPAVTSSGPRVVWEQLDATTGRSNVWVKNTVTGNTQVVNAMPTNQENPDIMDNYVTWQQENLVTGFESVYVRNIVSGNWGVLSNAAANQEDARIGKNQTGYQVVFTQDGNFLSGDRIMIKTIGTSAATPATPVDLELFTQQEHADISGNIVVYQERGTIGMNQFKIEYVNLVTGEEAQISGIPGWQTRPKVSGVNVVYQSHDTLWITNLSVLVLNPGAATRKLSNLVNDPDMENFDIDGNRVVWQQEVNNVRDVWVMNIATGNTMKVSSSLVAQEEPAISGDIVIWVQKTLPFDQVWWRNIATGQNGKVT